MAAYTGIVGTPTAQDDIYVDSAPEIFFQDKEGTNPLNNPDADGYYWGLSGTSSAPVYRLGCYEAVSFGDNVEINTIRCDKDGDTATTQRRNYLELTFTLKTQFPLSVLKHLIKGSAHTTSGGEYEKMGLGTINNNQFYRFWIPQVYDVDNGDWVGIQLHKAQFVDNFQWAMTYANPWTTQITVRAYKDDDLPDTQKFATIIRHDASAIS